MIQCKTLIKKVSLMGLLLLSGFKAQAAHVDALGTLERFYHPQSFSTKLRWGLFDHKDHSNLNDPKSQTSQPDVVWARMRQNFDLDHAEHHPRVKKYIREYTQSNYHLNQLSRNASPYMFLIVEEVQRRGVPLEIALLPMVESNFNPQAISRTGAHGLWQIMPATGKILGLEQDQWYDGRQDIQASTRAALNHLQYLYRTFDGDWLLALAAYNSGERRVIQAIRKNKQHKKPTDFWHLQLPQETQDYVPKLLALCAIVNHPTKYGVSLPALPNKPYAQAVEVGHQIDLNILSSIADIQIEELKKLNPAFRQNTTHPNGPHRLLIPVAKAPHLVRQLRRTDPAKWLDFAQYKIQPGDSLSTIAHSFNASVEDIKLVNKLTSNRIQAGQTLLIPSGIAPKPEESKIVHVVKNGDSLWSISRRYKAEIGKIKAWNKLKNETLKPGQELIIYST